MAVFGRDFIPDPTTLFPGNRYASVNAFGMAQGTYNLELRAKGQIVGDGGVEQNGIAGDLARSLGVGGILNTRIPVQGNWSYDRGSQILAVTITANGFGQHNTETVRIRTTGRERGEIQGQDLAGRTWPFRRID